jgi:hypothetical protein
MVESGARQPLPPVVALGGHSRVPRRAGDDPELLFVTAMLHDLGVTPPFGWPEHRRERLREVTARLPRLDFSADFEGAVASQAERKPGSAAARLHAGGGIAAGLPSARRTRRPDPIWFGLW